MPIALGGFGAVDWLRAASRVRLVSVVRGRLGLFSLVRLDFTDDLGLIIDARVSAPVPKVTYLVEQAPSVVESSAKVALKSGLALRWR